MQIERTSDAELIRGVITHPAIWPHVSDDFIKDSEYYPTIEGLIWLKVFDENLLGIYMVQRHNFISYEIHTCMLPLAWGDKAKQASKLVLDWIFSNTDCLKLTTHVPENNPLALRYAKKAGLKEEGNNRKSIMKNGLLLDQAQLGITKEEYLCL